MSRRFNAQRDVTAADKAERAAWDAFIASPDRNRSDVASNPVKGDTFTVSDVDGLFPRIVGMRPGTYRVCEVGTDGTVGFSSETDRGHWYPLRLWASVLSDARVTVDPVYPPARMARRGTWERAATRLENARRKLAALPPAGHKRRKDGTTYPVASPRQNAAAKAGREAFARAAGRSLAFMGAALAFLVLFLSACN